MEQKGCEWTIMIITMISVTMMGGWMYGIVGNIRPCRAVAIYLVNPEIYFEKV